MTTNLSSSFTGAPAMNPQHTTRKLASIAAGLLSCLYAGIPALADDTEIFVGQGAIEGPEARPNILFIIDTSGSMDDHIITQPTYDPNTVYTGSCSTSRLYWTTGNNAGVPTCSASNDQWFNAAANKCRAATTAFAGNTGYFSGKAARYESRSSNGSYRNWVDFSASDAATKSQSVECESDAGNHGDGVNTSNLYARNGNSSAWGGNSNKISWNARRSYRIYPANYLNWWNEYRTSALSKLDIVKGVSKSLIDELSGVNIGLMRYSNNDSGNNNENRRAQGGMIVHPVEDVSTSATAIKSAIDAFTPDGFTPLSETLYEAGLYFAGKTWDYGSNSVPVHSVSTAMQTAAPTKYKSPMEYSCQNNYIVYLTDGLPTADTDANTKIGNLFTPAKSCGTGNGDCLDDMAEYMFQSDLSTLPGNQNVKTFTVGFDADFPLLSETATKGGGSYYTANDTATLANAFDKIVQEILDTNQTFTSPTVAVNAFNRTQNLNDLFITVFKPTDAVHWPGNLKKYRLDPTTGKIQDAHTPALDAVDDETGFFKDSALSYWSTSTDGDRVAEGGAASKLPDPASRNIYTYYTGSASTTLTNAANAFVSGNSALTDAMLDLTTPGRPSRRNLFSFARGVDVTDMDADGNVSEARKQMGDPLHARPATVIYGGTESSPDVDDAVVYAATNEGFVHAIDPSTGVELWSFIPDVMLPRLYEQYENPTTSTKFYGIDGNLQTLKIDHNKNGIVEPSEGDHVYLYFGMRRGGAYYYALDVTDKDTPKFLWKDTATQLPGLGQTWSTPSVTRVTVNSVTQTQPEDYVLIFGGGYEDDQDPNGATQLTSYSTDTTGNQVFMVDALTGARLWYAGGPGSSANLIFNGSSGRDTMNNSIPSDVRVIDLNSDGLADRMYVGDMGGRIWRFDITNGAAPNALVAGGVFASLGNADESSHPASSLRRFYYAPDVSLVRNSNETFLNLAIGSGYRASPLNLQVEERFYSLRDRNVFNKLTQSQYDSFSATTEADTGLIDVTTDLDATVGNTAKGWRISLTRDGEKVLSEARTFQNKIFFTTYTPYDGAPVDPCVPKQGTNRLFLVSVLDGDPVINRDNPADPPTSPDDREEDLKQGGIAPETVFVFPTPDEDCTGEDCKPPPQCLVGLESCGITLTNNPVRTFWTQQNIDAN